MSVDFNRIREQVEEDPCAVTFTEGGAVTAVWVPDGITPRTYVEIDQDEMSAYDSEELESILVELGYTQCMPTYWRANDDD